MISVIYLSPIAAGPTIAPSTLSCCEEVEAYVLLRSKVLYFTVITSTIIGLAIGSQGVRWLMAGALALIAVPLFGVVKRAAGDMMLTVVENRNRERASLKAHRAEESPGSDRREIPPATPQ